jgi:hypothetical protein
MTTQLYIYGCSTCGVNSVYVQRLKTHCLHADINLEIKNTKYDQVALEQHAAYLNISGINTDSYPPIVVANGVVSLLSEYQA